ncbi:MAG: tetratricopeptide repeat protein [Lewinellaceae bacterium]|nr:tetratricopeptide repeat protein [Lewinellaceae bacterium]MCB9296420.1 tetratricopeptide repeat protein [Lewinellaceae bacterium]
MKNLTLLLFACLSISTTYTQTTLTAKDWQEDLRFLQQTVHQDYPFLFKKTTAEAFDAAVEKLYAEIPKLQEHEILTGLSRIVSSFQYGHTVLGFRHSPVPYHKLPVNLYCFSDGIYVEGAHKDYEQALGAKVLKVEGKPVEEALAAIRPVVPAENDQFFKAYGLSYLAIPELLHAQGVADELKNTITLTLEKDGKVFDQTIAAVDAKGHDAPTEYGFTKPENGWLATRDQSATPHYLKNLDKIYYYEYLPEHKTVYVRHSQIQDDPSEAIPAFYERVFDFIEKNDVERLVLDVRLNGGGNNYKNKPIVTGIIRTEKINQVGKLFVIIGRRTFSACQNLVNELDNYTNAIFVGEPTAENINFYGDNNPVELPNSKVTAYLSFAWWQDKPQWENGDWLAPHLAADMSFGDYRSNRDPVLDAALNFSSDNFILDPMGYFTGLFTTGQMEKIPAEAQRMVKDPAYRFFDFEEEFNNAGYQLMNSGQVESALYVFQLNAQLFPDSANAWDSLAEANWKAGNTDKAIELYNKAIEMDPEGSVGENARGMLKKVKGGGR